MSSSPEISTAEESSATVGSPTSTTSTSTRGRRDRRGQRPRSHRGLPHHPRGPASPRSPRPGHRSHRLDHTKWPRVAQPATGSARSGAVAAFAALSAQAASPPLELPDGELPGRVRRHRSPTSGRALLTSSSIAADTPVGSTSMCRCRPAITRVGQPRPAAPWHRRRTCSRTRGSRPGVPPPSPPGHRAAQRSKPPASAAARQPRPAGRLVGKQGVGLGPPPGPRRQEPGVVSETAQELEEHRRRHRHRSRSRFWIAGVDEHHTPHVVAAPTWAARAQALLCRPARCRRAEPDHQRSTSSGLSGAAVGASGSAGSPGPPSWSTPCHRDPHGRAQRGLGRRPSGERVHDTGSAKEQISVVTEFAMKHSWCASSCIPSQHVVSPAPSPAQPIRATGRSW